jgi:hypothetical protein
MVKQAPIPAVGDRYADDDPRNEGRVVEVRKINHLSGRAQVQVEVHPRNPSAVGITRWISFSGLATRYTKVSH